MSKNIENKDSFSQQVSNKLSGFEMQVRPEVWDGIAQQLQQKPRKNNRKIMMWWISSGIAASIALFLVFRTYNFFDVQTYVAQNVKESNTPNVNAEVSTFTPEQNITNSAVQSTIKSAKVNRQLAQGNKVSVKNEKVNISSIVKEDISVRDDQTKADELVTLNNMSENLNTDSAKNTQSANTLSEKKTLQLADNEKFTELKENDWEDPLNKQKKSDFELVAVLGSSQSISSPASGMAYDYLSFTENVLRNQSITNSFNTIIPNFESKSYLPPLSAGLSVAKMLGKSIFVESGLRYTYLNTVYKNSNADANLRLHYIGIPVNIGIRFGGNRKWYFYTSAGMMLEKGLWSVYNQNIYYSNSTYNTTISASIDGVQLSANVSAGVGYYLSKQFSLYLEPEMGYYFDNNQPESSRTENPLSVGIKGGVRFHL